MARDVAQQVFAMLAARARMLIGRRNIAGWLYRVAGYIGARAVRAERRRVAAHEQLRSVGSSAAAHVEECWPQVEEAITSLKTTDREALVLHYFQDLSYPEMAATVGIAEPAARKRVSRALQALEKQLRHRGVQRSATAVLAGAVAQQSGIATSSGIAASAIASCTSASLPFAITIQTIMMHTTTKIAIAAVAAVLIPLSVQWSANAKLREKIIAAQNVTLPSPSRNSEGGAAQLAALQAKLSDTRSAIMAAENERAELVALKRKIETEVVYSMGTVESMARKLAEIIVMTDTIEARQEALQRAHKADANSEETKRLTAEMNATAFRAAEMMPQIIDLVREMARMERSPEKAAHFYATVFGEIDGLDEAARAKLEVRFEPWIRELQQNGLALPQRPAPPQSKQWDQRRGEITTAFLKSLSTEFPATKGSRKALEGLLSADPEETHGFFDVMLGREDQP
jgi:RNA polymerase sigma-70 factor (ECF subfamily)